MGHGGVQLHFLGACRHGNGVRRERVQKDPDVCVPGFYEFLTSVVEFLYAEAEGLEGLSPALAVPLPSHVVVRDLRCEERDLHFAFGKLGLRLVTSQLVWFGLFGLAPRDGLVSIRVPLDRLAVLTWLAWLWAALALHSQGRLHVEALCLRLNFARELFPCAALDRELLQLLRGCEHRFLLRLRERGVSLLHLLQLLPQSDCGRFCSCLPEALPWDRALLLAREWEAQGIQVGCHLWCGVTPGCVQRQGERVSFRAYRVGCASVERDEIAEVQLHRLACEGRRGTQPGPALQSNGNSEVARGVHVCGYVVMSYHPNCLPVSAWEYAPEHEV
eukprot:6465543-Amphidinium_carterae.3